MKFIYDKRKSEILKAERGVSLGDIIELIESGHLLKVKTYSNPKKYPNQSMLEVDVKGYVWLIPCILKGEQVILKTAYPSRKATKNYEERAQDEKNAIY